MTRITALKLLAFAMLGLPMLRADAFLDVNGVFTTIAVPGAQPGTTVATSINDLGQIAGWFYNSSGLEGAFVDTNGVFTTVSPPILGGAPGLFVRDGVAGINDAGQIVMNVFGQFQAVYVDANGVYRFVIAGNAVANGINNSGQVVVYGEGPGVFVSEIINANGTFANIYYPGSSNTFAAGINNAGEVVGLESNGPSGSDFLWSNGTFTLISLPGTPSGINDSGQIIGNAGGFGYLDTNGVIQTIAVPGSTGTVPRGINDAGAIVGTFTPAVVPEPASLVLAAAGLTGIALLKRYRAAARP